MMGTQPWPLPLRRATSHLRTTSHRPATAFHLLSRVIRVANAVRPAAPVGVRAALGGARILPAVPAAGVPRTPHRLRHLRPRPTPLPAAGHTSAALSK